MLAELHEQTGSGELSYTQRQSLETLVVARGDALSRYPDPQGILNMKANTTRRSKRSSAKPSALAPRRSASISPRLRAG